MTSDAATANADARRLLLKAIRDPAAMADLPDAELDLTLRVARRARLLGRLGHALKTRELLETLPQVVADQFLGALAMADARARLARWELDRIDWALGADSSMPLITMKGCTYLLLDLPNVHGRIFADVDLMTTEQELEPLESVLNARGWKTTELTPYDQNYYRRWTHELPPLMHEEREVEIDLHHNVMPRTARLKPDSAMLVEASQPVAGSRYRVLADEDIVLHAMVHLMFDSDLGDKLRDLVDIADLLQHFTARDAEFPRRLLDRAETLDLLRPAYYSLRYTTRLLGLELPGLTAELENRGAPNGIVVWLMDRLVPRALIPEHPDRPRRLTGVARLLLYMRSHWIRMPPWLLAYHLSYKFVVTRLRGKQAA